MPLHGEQDRPHGSRTSPSVPMVDAQPGSIPSSPVDQKDVLDKKDKAKRNGQIDRSAASRVDIDVPMNKLHEILGDRWSTYQSIVGDFLTGRSTHHEFETALQPLISSTRNFIRHHNDILLALLTNTFRETPVAASQSLGWTKKRRDPPTTRSRDDPAAKRLKTEVMGLSNRERARIKNIPKPDASLRLRPNSMIETRFAKLPRVPVTPQKINSSQHHIDIVRGFHVPLCTESRHLPDPASLKDRILATCLENGLLGGLEESVPELLINGLEIHLRNVLTSTISRLRHNRPDCVLIPEPDNDDDNHHHGRNVTVGHHANGFSHHPLPSAPPPPLPLPPAPLPTLTTAPTKPNLPITSSTPSTTIMKPHELAFTYTLAPYTFIEPSHPITRMISTHLDDATSEVGVSEVSGEMRGSQRVKVAMMLDELI